LTTHPAPDDIRHLEVFLSEHKTAKQGFLVCQVPRKLKLSKRVLALPWQAIGEVLAGVGEN